MTHVSEAIELQERVRIRTQKVKDGDQSPPKSL